MRRTLEGTHTSTGSAQVAGVQTPVLSLSKHWFAFIVLVTHLTQPPFHKGMSLLNRLKIVIPATAGIHNNLERMDSDFRRNDGFSMDLTMTA